MLIHLKSTNSSSSIASDDDLLSTDDDTSSTSLSETHFVPLQPEIVVAPYKNFSRYHHRHLYSEKIFGSFSPQKSPKRKIQKSRFKNIISGVPQGTVTGSLRELIFGEDPDTPRRRFRYRDPRHTEFERFCYAVKLSFSAGLLAACIFLKFLLRIFQLEFCVRNR